MDTPLYTSGSARFGRGVLLLLLALFAFHAVAAPASATQEREASVLPPPATAPAPVLAWSWRKLYAPIEATLSNRRRMIQLATVVMCIGLYIMMRK